MSGRDVAIACMLGAEEFGFATAPLITLGCVMMRQCQSDTCPMGVATQNPELRKRFAGKPEYVENFMYFIARQLREIMARLGIRTVEELVGRNDLLKVKDHLTDAQKKIDLSGILLHMDGGPICHAGSNLYDFQLDKTKDESILLTSREVKAALERGKKAELTCSLQSVDRAFGTLLGAEITRRNPDGLAEDTITVDCIGSGGQSFGAFIPKGLTLKLTGDSNDYFGKGLSGGKLIISVPADAAYDPDENIIIGNVALYGATSGKAYIAGIAGERFAIRNSGAVAVVEGVGEHGCEYMTGGTVVILGDTGKNFGAGMSGGVAYVLDEKNRLYKNLNKQLVSMEAVEKKEDLEELKTIIGEHVEATGSEKGKRILAHFADYIPHFKKIIPDDYKEILHLIAKEMETGTDPETAKIEAFRAFRDGPFTSVPPFHPGS